MTFPRYFTPAQANELIPELSPHLDEVTRLVRRARALSTPAKSQAQELRPEGQLDELEEEIGTIIDEIRSHGVQVKAIDPTLLDFPALRNGVEVVLSWREGDDKVNWWHPTHADFSARKRLDPDHLGYFEWENLSSARELRFVLIAVLTVVIGVYLMWPGPTPDVVLVVWDTVRADRVDQLPTLSKLASRGWVVERAVSPATWTLPGHASLFTGLHPREHGAHGRSLVLDGAHQTIAEAFSEAGYRTLLYTENPWVGAETGLDQGFGEVIARHDPSRRAVGWVPGQAERDVLAWMDAEDTPSFVVLNWMDAHAPRRPSAESREATGARPEPMRPLLQPAPDPENERALYDAALLDLDGRLAALLEGLDDPILMVTSDHGELLSEHGLSGHHQSVHEPILHVPWITVGPDVAALREPKPRSTLEVPGTLAWLAGIPWSGRSVVDPPPLHVISERIADPPTVLQALSRDDAPQLAVRAGSTKWMERVGTVDLDADPAELSPGPAPPDLTQAGAEYRASTPPIEDRAGSGPGAAALRALGYLEPGPSDTADTVGK